MRDSIRVEKRLPDFLVLGTAKAGTSSLYDYLGQHTDIYLSPITELNFFAHEGCDLQFNGPGDQSYLWQDSLVATYEDYCKQFASVRSQAAIGEISTHNLYSPQAPGLIKRHLPHAKLIAILRNPAERAFSAFTHMVRDGREETADFRVALTREPERIRNNWEPLWHYKSMGFYGVQLDRYFQLFDPGQMRVYLYEDFVARPLDIMADIFTFIGVDTRFVPDMSERRNVSYLPRSRRLHRLATSVNPVRSGLRYLVPKKFRADLRKLVMKGNLTRPRLDHKIRQELANCFRDDIALTGQLIKRDLSNWLK